VNPSTRNGRSYDQLPWGKYLGTAMSAMAWMTCLSWSRNCAQYMLMSKAGANT